MTLIDIVEKLPAHFAHRAMDYSSVRFRHISAGDLMSDVLACDLDELLIVSSLAAEQTVRTADIVGARAILLVNDKVPTTIMKRLAEQRDISLLSTPLSLFEACVSLGRLLQCGGFGDSELTAMEAKPLSNDTEAAR